MGLQPATVSTVCSRTANKPLKRLQRWRDQTYAVKGNMSQKVLHEIGRFGLTIPARAPGRVASIKRKT